MSSSREVIPTRFVVALVAVVFAVCLLGTMAVAQNQPKDEVFGGYSWLHPNGWASTFDYAPYKVPDIKKGFDISNTYYFPQAHNLGFVIDGSGHWDGRNGIWDAVGYPLAGLQYKYHAAQLSPFARMLVGAARISPTYLPNEWKPAIGGGGGLDLNIGDKFALRIGQFDYIYTTYNPKVQTGHTTTWNSIRLATGVVYNIGNYYAPTPTASCSASPASVTVNRGSGKGEPVTVTATGTNFNPKHTVQYLWNTTGGKLSGTDAATETINTDGMKAGSYTANATMTDPKGPKAHNVANCGANFTVNVPANPPQVACQANPTTVQAGTPSTITASATSPDGVEITSYAYQTTAGNISGTGTTATLDTTGAQAGPTTVTVTATDAGGLTGTCTTTVNVEVPPPPPQVSAKTPIQFIQRPHQKYIPWRVDNEAKGILDDDASALKNDPNAKLVIVGYADGEPAITTGKGKNKMTMDLAAQRAVNAKAYLVQQQGIDPSRIEVRKGTGKDHVADIFWVPQGADMAAAPLLQNTTAVDESVVKPSENAYPKPKTEAPVHRKAKKAAAPAQ